MNYACILKINDKELNEVIYELGFNSSHIETSENATKLVYPKGYSKLISLNVFEFLESVDFINDVGELSEKGKNYYKGLHIFEEVDACFEIMKTCIISNPIVKLVLQVFSGRGKVSKIKLCNLLNLHRVNKDKSILENEINSFLIFLNKYKIIIYDKKNSLFKVNNVTFSSQAIDAYFVEPTTPYSNIYNMKKVIHSCYGDIFWIDKHFRKDGFGLLVDGLSFNGVSSVTIISGEDNLTKSARDEYFMLKAELAQKNVKFSWRIVKDSSFKWHDRWLIAKNNSFNIPPVLALLRGQRSEIIKTKTRIDVENFIAASEQLI